MATKDNLKLFKDENGYDIVVGKPEIDENFELLADELDDRIVKSGDSIKILAKGVFTDNNNTIGNDNATAFGLNNEINRSGGIVSGIDNIVNGSHTLTGGDTNTNDGDNSIVMGNNNISSAIDSAVFGTQNNISGARNFCIGQSNVSSAPDVYNFGSMITGANTQGFRLNFGGYFDNSQDASRAFGVYYYKNIETFFMNKTDDDAQTENYTKIILYPKSLAYITIKGQALQDDYSTKWIFERKLIVLVDADGVVTISDDSNTDIVKDDSDWAFDVSSSDSDDDNPPMIKTSVTGKADTNIVWGGLIDIHFVEDK